MSPLTVPKGTPGFDPWRGFTPQPTGWKAWVALVAKIIKALRKK